MVCRSTAFPGRNWPRRSITPTTSISWKYVEFFWTEFHPRPPPPTRKSPSQLGSCSPAERSHFFSFATLGRALQAHLGRATFYCESWTRGYTKKITCWAFSCCTVSPKRVICPASWWKCWPPFQILWPIRTNYPFLVNFALTVTLRGCAGSFLKPVMPSVPSLREERAVRRWLWAVWSVELRSSATQTSCGWTFSSPLRASQAAIWCYEELHWN